MEKTIAKIIGPPILLADDNLMIPVRMEDKAISFAFLSRSFSPLFDRDFLSAFVAPNQQVEIQGEKLANNVFNIFAIRPPTQDEKAVWYTPGNLQCTERVDPAMRSFLVQQRSSDYQAVATGTVSKLIWTDYPDKALFRFLHYGKVHRGNGEITAVGDNPYVKVTGNLARAFMDRASEPFSTLTCFLSPNQDLLAFLDCRQIRPMLYTESQVVDLKHDCAAPLAFDYGAENWQLQSQLKYQTLLNQIDQYNWRDQLLMDLIYDRDKDKSPSSPTNPTRDKGKAKATSPQETKMAKEEEKRHGKNRFFRRWLGKRSKLQICTEVGV